MTTYKTNPWLVSTVLLLGLILGYLGAMFSGGAGFALPGFAPAGPELKMPTAESFKGLQQSLTKEGYPLLGNPNAKITLTEYSDFQCPFCERFATSVNPPAAYPQIVQTYVKTGQAKLIFRNFPLPFHPNAQPAAEAALCAADQKQFWQFHDALFLNQKIWENEPTPTGTFVKIAKKLKLDKGDFQSCLDGKKYASHVQKDLQAGMTAGVEGTPTVFVGADSVVGAKPFAAFQQAIEAALNPVAADTLPPNAETPAGEQPVAAPKIEIKDLPPTDAAAPTTQN